MFSVAPNIVLAPYMMQNTERKHRMQDTNTANFRSLMLVVVVVLLFFGSRVGTHQIRDQSRALEDSNDSNNSLEVYTPNSFIHLLYNSPYMDVVDMHNILIIPSVSVLWVKTVEAS